MTFLLHTNYKIKFKIAREIIVCSAILQQLNSKFIQNGSDSYDGDRDLALQFPDFLKDKIVNFVQNNLNLWS